MADPIVRAFTTLVNDLKGAEDETMRRSVLWDGMRRSKQIKYNQTGDDFRWRLRYNLAPVETNDGTGTVTPTQKEWYKAYILSWEGNLVHDLMTKKEKLVNRGKEAMIRLWTEMEENLRDSMQDAMAREPFIDGPANPGRMSGIDSFMAHTQTIDSTNTTTTARAANAADPFGYPDDSYGGQNTDLGDWGGEWEGGPWPFGTGEAAYDANAPLILNHTSTYFGGSTFRENCVKAIRLALLMSRRNVLPSRGMIDLVLMDVGGFYDFANKHDAKERVQVTKALRMDEKFGPDTREGIYQDGALVAWEFYVPTNSSPGQTGEATQFYGFNKKAMWFHSLQDRVYKMDPKAFHQFYRMHAFILDCLGQFKFRSPREFFKGLSIA